MHTTDTSQPEERSKKAVGSYGLPSAHGQPVAQQSRPRTQPPAWHSTPPSVVLKAQNSLADYYPPLFIGFLALVFLGSIAYLLLGSDQGDTELTPEEIHVLAEGTLYRSTGSATASSPSSAVESDAETGSSVLYVDTTPSGASVTIDGDVVGETPLRLEHLPSKWRFVTLEKDGFRARDTLVYLSEEMETTVSLVLSSSSSRRNEPRPEGRAERTGETTSRAKPSASTAPTSGALSVRVTPEGVPVQLDGQTVGVAPLDLKDIAPGPHTLKFFLPDYETATVHVDVTPGERESVDVAMVLQTGKLAVVVRPWGSIYVDGTLVAQNTDVRFDTALPVGRHHIRVVHPDLGSEERTIDIQADGTASATFHLK